MNNMLPRPQFWAETANCLRRRHSAFGELLIYYLLCFLAFLLQSVLISIPMAGRILQTKSDELMQAFENGTLTQDYILTLLEQMPDWMSVFVMFAGVTIGLAAVFYCRRFQKRSFSSMGLCGKHRIAECVLGVAVGMSLVTAVIALGAATGGYRLFYTRPSGNTGGRLLLAALGCVVYGSSLELMTQGYFAPTLGAGRPVALALVLSSLVSGMMHSGDAAFSVGTFNGLLLGLLLGIWVLKRGNLWGACGLHAAWLFTENYFFDVAPADAHSRLRLFAADADPFRPLLSGGEYGPMYSICATVILLAALAAVLALKPRDVAAPQDPAAPDAQQTNFL